MEAVLLAMIVLSPWAFGSYEPAFEFALYGGVAILAVLWAAKLLIEWRLVWRRSLPALLLGAIFLVGVIQVIPLPRGILERVAPNTAWFYDQLLPAEPEELPGGVERDRITPPPGSTLSLYPAATQRNLVRQLAIFLVFGLVLQLTTRERIQRLAAAALINGALLSLLGLAQYFSPTGKTLYWVWESPGRNFGPFINRNHFAFYGNLCIGLGFGLLVSRRTHLANRSRRADRGGWLPRDLLRTAAELLQDPASLWICLGLALLGSGVAMSLSRGGLLTLAGTLLLCLALCAWRPPPGASFLIPLFLALALAMGLTYWLGAERVEQRLESVWSGEAAEGLRLSMWKEVLGLVPQFPIWGTGYGTFRFTETLFRSPEHSDMVYVHAHNEYIEALLEGGVLRAALTAVLFAVLLAQGLAGYLRYRRRSVGGLALGGFFAMLTMVIHSIGEFGLHIPAITLLATVIAGQVAVLGSRAGLDPERAEEASYRLRLFGLAPLAAAATLVAIAAGLLGVGWRETRSQSYRIHADRLRTRDLEGTRPDQAAYFDLACWADPTNARFRMQAAQTHLEAIEAARDKLDRQSQFQGIALDIILGFPLVRSVPGGVPGPALAQGIGMPLGWGVLSGAVLHEAEERHLAAALRHFLAARDLCPLLGGAQLQISANADVLAKGDPPERYLERAKLLIPNDPFLWYQAGLQELVDGDPNRAAASWRKSLTLSSRFLDEILTRSAGHFTPDQVLDWILPDDPELVYQASRRLFPAGDASEAKSRFLKQAASLMEREGRPATADGYRLLSLVQRELGMKVKATENLRKAVIRNPNAKAWRWELIGYLVEAEKFAEARRELLEVLRREPENKEARSLFELVDRKSFEQVKSLPLTGKGDR